jgi:hypothetical protein
MLDKWGSFLPASVTDDRTVAVSPEELEFDIIQEGAKINVSELLSLNFHVLTLHSLMLLSLTWPPRYFCVDKFRWRLFP